MPEPRSKAVRVSAALTGRSAVASAGAGSGVAMSVLSTLMAGMLFWGAMGWLLDLWLGTRFIVAIGAVAGLGLATYIIVVKYGEPAGPPPTKDGGPVLDTDAGTREEQL